MSTNVNLFELKIGVPLEMFQVSPMPSREVVQNNNLMAFGKKTIYQVTTNKPGPTSYKTAHLLFCELKERDLMDGRIQLAAVVALDHLFKVKRANL